MNEIQLDLLCHADFSGRIRPSRDNVGFCAFSAQIDRLRAANPEGTVLLDAGDAFSTSFWGGLPMVKASNLNQTDVMCLGNHEFDHGAAVLEECIKACDFPVLCANIHQKVNKEAIPGTMPAVILEKCGIRIGILGITTEYTPYMVKKPMFDAYEVSSAAEAAAKYIPILRQQGAEVIVVLTHLPFYRSEEGELSGELWDLMENAPEADVWIGGHIPGDCAQIEKGACVVKAGFGGTSLAHVHLRLDGESHRIIDRKCEVLQTPRNLHGRPEVETYIHSVTDPFEEYFTQKLSMAEELWPMRLARECHLGDLLADCLRDGGGTELAYMNATSAGGAIDPGPVTRESLTEVSGFNDPIYVGTMTGQQVWDLMEMVYEPERFGNNAGVLISGFHVTLDHTKSSPNKVLAVTLPDGTPLKMDKEYTVTTSAYMASGGSGTDELASRIQWEKKNILFYDAMFDYVSKLRVLSIPDFPRLKETGTPENDHSPF